MNIEITQPEIEIEAHTLDCKIDAIKAKFSEHFDEEDVEMLIQLSMKLGELYAQRDFNKKLEDCVVVPENKIQLNHGEESFQFDLIDLLRRSLKSSKILKTRENWSHVSKMLGVGSTVARLICKEMQVEPYSTLMVVEAARGGK